MGQPYKLLRLQVAELFNIPAKVYVSINVC